MTHSQANLGSSAPFLRFSYYRSYFPNDPFLKAWMTHSQSKFGSSTPFLGLPFLFSFFFGFLPPFSYFARPLGLFKACDSSSILWIGLLFFQGPHPSLPSCVGLSLYLLDLNINHVKSNHHQPQPIPLRGYINTQLLLQL